MQRYQRRSRTDSSSKHFKRARNPPRTGRFPDDPRLYRGSHRRGSGVWATNALAKKLCTRMTSHHQSTRAVGRFPLPHVPIHPCTSRYNTRLGAKLSDHQSGEKALPDAQTTLFSDLHVAGMDMLLFSSISIVRFVCPAENPRISPPSPLEIDGYNLGCAQPLWTSATLFFC